MPTTILNGFLYLGSYDTASRQELLKAMGITHILNVSSGQGFAWPAGVCPALILPLTHCCTLQTVPTCPALYKNTFTYHTVELAPPEFDECFNFLGKFKTQQLAQTRLAGVTLRLQLAGTCLNLHRQLHQYLYLVV
jgi:dual specificity MAP kinase phosphatase